MAFIIGAINRIGTEEPWASYAQHGRVLRLESYIVNPRGEIEAQASYGDDELLVHEIDLDMVRTGSRYLAVLPRSSSRRLR